MVERNRDTNRSSQTQDRRQFCRVCFAALASALVLPGCKTLNEDPKNDRFWFPTIAPPSKKERELRGRYAEGGDPYVDANVGPKSFNTRPKGCTDQRSRTYYDDEIGGY